MSLQVNSLGGGALTEIYTLTSWLGTSTSYADWDPIYSALDIDHYDYYLVRFPVKNSSTSYRSITVVVSKLDFQHLNESIVSGTVYDSILLGCSSQGGSINEVTMEKATNGRVRISGCELPINFYGIKL